MYITLKSTQVKEAKSFLSLVKSDYIIFGLTKSEAFIMCDTKELYTHINMPVISVDDFNDDYLFIRVPKKQFLSLWIEGLLVLSIEGDRLNIKFKDASDNLIVMYSCTLQIDLASNYLERLEFLTNIKDYPQISLPNIKAVLKTAKLANIPVKASNNYIIAQAKNFAIYQEYAGTPFACFPNILNALSNYTEVVYNKENALVYLSKDRCAILTKCIATLSTDIVSACKKQRSECRCKINIKCLLSFITNIKMKDTGVFKLDLAKKEAQYTYEKDRYTIPLEMQEVQLSKSEKQKYKEQVQKSQAFDIDSLDVADTNTTDISSIASTGYQPPIITVPLDVISKIFPQCLNIITLTVKVNCILIQSGNTNIIFGRGNSYEIS